MPKEGPLVVTCVLGYPVWVLHTLVSRGFLQLCQMHLITRTCVHKHHRCKDLCFISSELNNGLFTDGEG